MRVHAESVHVLAVAHKVFDLPGGQRLDNRHKRVAQLVQAARRQAVGGAVGFPAAVIVWLAGNAKHTADAAGDLPLIVQHPPGQCGHSEGPHRVFVLAARLFALDID